jgi:hypothetical protein
MEKLHFMDYSFDLDAITTYCQIKSNQQKDNQAKKENTFRQQEISDSYQLNDEQEMVLAEKIVHEVITPQETPLYDEFKLDLVKMLLTTILTEKPESGNSKPSFSLSSLMVLQTFIEYGFIKKITTEE